MRRAIYIVVVLFAIVGASFARGGSAEVKKSADSVYVQDSTAQKGDTAEYDYFIDEDGDGIGDLFQKIFGSEDEKSGNSGSHKKVEKSTRSTKKNSHKTHSTSRRKSSKSSRNRTKKSHTIRRRTK
ncbi:hypothetical protein J7K99_03125 [bacterium]|nr:hypothetical protein [bacterium]